MCKINMTFEVPDNMSIDIEALKTQMHGYLNFILTMPSIRKQEDNPADSGSEEEGWEASPELLERLEKARKEIEEGNCVVCRNHEELQAFLDSL